MAVLRMESRVDGIIDSGHAFTLSSSRVARCAGFSEAGARWCRLSKHRDPVLMRGKRREGVPSGQRARRGGARSFGGRWRAEREGRGSQQRQRRRIRREWPCQSPVPVLDEEMVLVFRDRLRVLGSNARESTPRGLNCVGAQRLTGWLCTSRLLAAAAVAIARHGTWLRETQEHAGCLSPPLPHAARPSARATLSQPPT
jgi:hypothetical protein